MTTTFPHHHESQGVVTATIDEVFSYLDDPRHIAEHMESSSAMMAGSAMRVDVDARAGRVIGSQIRMSGRMCGLTLSLEEAVTERDAPRHKAWQTFGTPRLIVIGHYRMGFDLAPVGATTRLCVWIDYELPSSGLPHWLARPLARVYARWCTDQMVRTTQQHFTPVAQPVWAARSSAVHATRLRRVGMEHAVVSGAELPRDGACAAACLRDAAPLVRLMGQISPP